jgi:hypothetical protein
MAKAELVFKERLRLNETYAAAAEDSSLEVSFESWNCGALAAQARPMPRRRKVGTTSAAAASSSVSVVSGGIAFAAAGRQQSHE